MLWPPFPIPSVDLHTSIPSLPYLWIIQQVNVENNTYYFNFSGCYVTVLGHDIVLDQVNIKSSKIGKPTAPKY